MGYTPKSTVLRLNFDAVEGMEGFVVRCRRVTVDEYLEVMGLKLAALKPTSAEAAREMLTRLYQALVNTIQDWNLEVPAGTPVEPSAKAILDQEKEWASNLLKAWEAEVVGVSTPLGSGSRPGAPQQPSEDLELPMQPLADDQSS